ncbi:MAG: PilZ domain-containing protein [Candidatus Firestonebacteria bacterium]|nr:PilZ domain-containing protein [Candidatus Firestonebacteria bacterium]
MEKDGRACPRLKMKLPLQCKYVESGKIYHALEGEVEDVGARGVSMVIDRRLEIGQKLLVTLFLPAPGIAVAGEAAELEEGGLLPVLVLADVVWCQPSGPEQYKVGIKFLVPDLHHGKRFIRFLNDYQLDGSLMILGESPFEGGEA